MISQLSYAHIEQEETHLSKHIPPIKSPPTHKIMGLFASMHDITCYSKLGKTHTHTHTSENDLHQNYEMKGENK